MPQIKYRYNHFTYIVLFAIIEEALGSTLSTQFHRIHE